MQQGSRNFWDDFSSWEEAESAWDAGAQLHQDSSPLKACRALGQVPFVDPKMTPLSMRLKALSWILRRDEERSLLKSVLKNPFKHGMRYLLTLFGKRSFVQDGDLFLYNTKGPQEFALSLDPQKSLLIVGFSYCQKPFECPCSRFSDHCTHSPSHPVCRQCPIGKVVNCLPTTDNTMPVLIPTINYIGKVVLDAIQKHPQKEVCFLITSCHMALSMFADLSFMVNVKGIGFRLHGHFCNTFKAFQLSEEGIKPGRTELSHETSERLFDVLKKWRQKNASRGAPLPEPLGKGLPPSALLQTGSEQGA